MVQLVLTVLQVMVLLLLDKEKASQYLATVQHAAGASCAHYTLKIQRHLLTVNNGFILETLIKSDKYIFKNKFIRKFALLNFFIIIITYILYEK